MGLQLLAPPRFRQFRSASSSINLVFEGAPREMDTGLDQLRRAGLLFARGVGDQTTYTFRHALLQDATYGTLLRAKRQEVHARIAQTLEREHPEICDIQPELFGIGDIAAHAGVVSERIAEQRTRAIRGR